MAKYERKDGLMVATSTAPYPYRRPLLAQYKLEIPEFGSPKWENANSFPAIDDATDTAWQQAKIILAGVIALANEKPFAGSSGFSLPARVELIWSRGNPELRGLVVFDTQGRLIVHVENALLGYNGSGPSLSQQILSFLDVSPETFEEIQASAWNRPYLIVLSRQRHEAHKGIDVAYPTLDVEPEWTWWDASATPEALLE